MKYTTYIIENYQYPYAVRIHFSHSQREVDLLHYKIEHEENYIFRRLGFEFHFESDDTRNQFVRRLGL